MPRLSRLLNKPSLEVAHELVCRFISGADEAEWALTGHPLINIPKIRQLSKMIDGMTCLINIPKIMQLSKMIDGMTSLINIPKIMQLSKMIDLCTK